MEDVIQILVFLVIVTSVIISKYKEVHANRPGQHARQSAQQSGQQSDQPDFMEFEDDETADQFDTTLHPAPSQKELSDDSFTPNPITDIFRMRPAESKATTAGMRPSYSTIESCKTMTDQLSNTDKPVVTQERTPVPSKKGPKVRFRTRHEARQAFIYSEIFNRKYE